MALLWLSFLLTLRGEFVTLSPVCLAGRLWQLKRNVRFEWRGSHTSTSLCIRSRKREDKDCLPWRVTEGDLCLISLGNPFCYFFFFFGAVGYFIKNKKPFDSILEERGKQQLTVSASLSSTCNLLTSHLHLCSCPSHISINLCFPHLATKSAVVLNVKTHLCSSCLFFLFMF